MAYTVTSPLVIAKDPKGADLYVYRGGIVPEGQSDDWVKNHLDSKMIAEAEAAEPSGDDGSGGSKSRRKSRRSRSSSSDD